MNRYRNRRAAFHRFVTRAPAFVALALLLFVSVNDVCFAGNPPCPYTELPRIMIKVANWPKCFDECTIYFERRLDLSNPVFDVNLGEEWDRDPNRTCACQTNDDMDFEWEIAGVPGAILRTPLGEESTHFLPGRQINQVEPYSSAYGVAVLYKTVWNLAEQEHEYENPCPYQDGPGALVTKQCWLVFADMVGDAWSALQNGVSWTAVPTPWADLYFWDIPNATDLVVTTVPHITCQQIQTVAPLFKGGEIILLGMRYDRVSGDESYNPTWEQELGFERLPKLFSIDLDIDGVTEAQEDDVGGFVRLDADDDSLNGKRDNGNEPNDPGPYDNEDDMVQIYLAKYPSNLSVGTIKLDVLKGNDKIRIYKSQQKGASNLLDQPEELQWAPSQMPPVLWVEGIGVTESPEARVELNLSCTIGTQKSEDLVRLTVYGIKKVEWEQLDGELGDNPGVGGGKKIFPDWPSPTAPSPVDKYQRVKVKATIKPAVAGRTIYFYNIDVDDPSANALPIDNESNAEDNHGGAGAIAPASANTNSSGIAESVFTTTLNPGDNFRIVASLAPVGGGFAPKQGDTEGHIYFPNHVGDVFIPDDTSSFEFFKATPMLTVWRHLWVERNSMGETPQWEEGDKLVYGPIVGASTDVGDLWLQDINAGWHLGAFYDRCWLWPNSGYTGDDGRYLIEDWDMEIFSVSKWLENQRNMDDLAAPEDEYKVTTEDAYTGDVIDPIMSLLKPALERAYVSVEEATNSYWVPWKHYIESPGMQAYTDDYSNKPEHNTDWYWDIYALGAYEWSQSLDQDSDDEDSYPGITQRSFYGRPEGSAIFVEINRDQFGAVDSFRWKQTAMHESGHQLGLPDHEIANCVMYQKCWDIGENTLEGKKFCDQCIAAVRGLEKPE